MVGAGGVPRLESSPKLRVEVQVDPCLESDGERLDANLLERAANVTYGEVADPEAAEMSLVITDDARMNELNRSYRGVDSTTDVLAFAATETAPDQSAAFVLPDEDGPTYLGDVVISLPQARRQAQERGHGLSSELCLLTVHGTLHLLGYDHLTLEEQGTMWALQRQVLGQLGCAEVAPEDEP